MSVSQKDIAARVGVNRSLVAHALRGDSRVSEITRQKVMEVAREMGYSAQSNVAARSLAASKFGRRLNTGILAVVTGQSAQETTLYDMPYFKPLFQGIEGEAARRDLDLYLCIARQGRLPRLLESGGVDGVICLHTWLPDAQKLATEATLPVLRVGDGAPGQWALMADYRDGIRQSTKHLLELGHRRIAFFGTVGQGGAQTHDVMIHQLFDGYRDAFAHANLVVDESWIDLSLPEASFQAGADALDRLKRRAPEVTAIVCYNDLPAMGAVRRARELGMRVPDDLSVTGFDDVWSKYPFDLPLSSVSYNRLELGCRAVEMVCDDATTSARELSFFPVEFVARNSTGVPR